MARCRARDPGMRFRVILGHRCRLTGAPPHGRGRRSTAKSVCSLLTVFKVFPSRCPSSPASPSPPASCISAARARPCSTGSMPSGMAAGCCCASRTRTGSGPRKRRSRRSSTACPGSGSRGTATWSISSPGSPGTARWPRTCSRREGLSLLCEPQELEEMREAARREALAVRRPLARPGPAEAPAGVKPVIRLKAPTEGETVVEDAVQGRRVAEQGSRRPRAASIRRHTDLHARGRGGRPRHGHHPRHPRRRPPHERGAADADLPGSRLGRAEHVAYPAHPRPRRGELSKRHGALGVEAYRSMGYLPEALRNYLVRLGWSHGDQEIFSTDEMVQAFDLGSIGRSPARFDFAKLESLNGHYMRQSSDEHLVRSLEALLPELGPPRSLGETFEPGLRARSSLRPCRASRSGRRRSSSSSTARITFTLGDRSPRRQGADAAGGGRRARRHGGQAGGRPEGMPRRWRRSCAPMPRLSARSSGRWRSPFARRSPAGRPPGLFDVMAVLGKEGKPGAAEGRARLSLNRSILSTRLMALYG